MVRGRSWIMVLALAAAVSAACSGDAGEANVTDRGDRPAQTPRPSGMSDTLPTGVTVEMVAQGEQQFKAGVCIACHGQDAAGTPIAPNLKDFEWLNTDGSYQGIQDVIRAGVPEPEQFPAAMPPMGGAQLTDQQISEIAAYIISIRGRY